MQVYLGLGSNIGNREQTLLAAVNMINERMGKVISLSAFYTTKPDGFESENHFLNAVCSIETLLIPEEILEKTQTIEKELGRTAKSHKGIYHDRTIDIDILLMEDLVMETEKLTIPHPLMHKRDFVLTPLAEIAPDLTHPVLKKKIIEIFKTL